MARGKYDDIVDKLPTWQHEEPNYQAKVDARKKEIVDSLPALTSAGLALLFKTSRQEKEQVEEELYKINIDLTAITQMLIDRYEIDGITSMQLDSGEKVAIRYEPYAVVEDKEKVRQWCLDNGYEREMQLSWNTLNAIMKERLTKGEAEPEGVKAFTRAKPVFYKK